MKTTGLLALSVLPMMIIMYYLHHYLIKIFDVLNLAISNNLFIFISAIAILMLSNLFLFQIIKPKIVGFVFLSWSMLKIMMVMAYFVFFVMKKDIILDHGTTFEFVTMYMLYLFVEVFYTIILIKNAPK